MHKFMLRTVKLNVLNMRKIFLLVLLWTLWSVVSIRGNSLTERLYQEKVYLHTDKPYYLKGDTIWLKGYLVDAQTHRMKDAQSRFLYVELINRKNKVVLRKKLKGDGGRFHNFLALDRDLEEAEYQLRAYTNYMRNNDEEYFFKQQISVFTDTPLSLITRIRYEKNEAGDDYAIIALLRREGTPYSKSRVEYLIHSQEYGNKFQRTYTNATGELRLKLPSIDKGVEPYVYLMLYEGDHKFHKRISLRKDYEYTVGFYPEGGHLIAGAEQTVGFKAESSTGEIMDISGVVVNQRKDTLARLHSEYAGIGSVKLRAALSDTLWACVEDGKGNAQKFRLPLASDEYVAITVQREGNELHYRLLYPESYSSGETFGLLVHTRGKVIRNGVLSRRAPSGSLSCDSLPEGITHFAVYNKDTVVVSERLVFVRKPGPVFQLTSSRLPDEGRMPVKMGLRLVDQDLQPLQGNFSLSVTDDYAVTVNEERQNLPSYLLLASDLREPIHNPGYYLADETEEVMHHTDQLMLTHGWRRFDVAARMKGEMPLDTVYAVERFQQIGGYAETHFNHERLSNLSLLIENRTDAFKKIAVTDNDGNFSFRIDRPQRENLLMEFFVHGYGKKPKWRYGIYLNRQTYPSADKLHWQPAWSLSADSAYIKGMREGFSIINGEKVYKVPEVEITALRLPNGWVSYNTVETERIDQVAEANALDLIAKIPGIALIYDRYGRMKVAVPRKDLELGAMRSGIKRGNALPVFWKPVPILLDGKRVTELHDLEYLDSKDVKAIDFVQDNTTYIVDVWTAVDSWNWNDDGEIMDEEEVVKYTQMGIGIRANQKMLVHAIQPQKIYIRTYLSQGILESSVPSVARVGYLSYAPDAKFYAPQYPTPGSRKIVNSDKRSTLYWEPDIRLNDKGEVGFSFYTADRPSTYTVVIEGITTDGKACRYVKRLE